MTKTIKSMSQDGSRIVRGVLGLTVAVAALSLSSSALAAQEQGMVVVRDAETGQLRAPNASEFKSLKDAEAAAKPKHNLPESSATVGVVKVRANGSKHVHLGEESMVYSVLTRDADGKTVMQCVTGAEAASAAATNPASVKNNEEHQHDVK